MGAGVSISSGRGSKTNQEKTPQPKCKKEAYPKIQQVVIETQAPIDRSLLLLDNAISFKNVRTRWQYFTMLFMKLINIYLRRIACAQYKMHARSKDHVVLRCKRFKEARKCMQAYQQQQRS